jgi:hypothetical protein
MAKEAYDLGACLKKEKEIKACKGRPNVIQLSCECKCAEGTIGDPYGEAGCAQQCPDCPCNIIEVTGTLQCDGQKVALLPPQYPDPNAAVCGQGDLAAFPERVTHSDNVVYCCPTKVPQPKCH